MEVVEAKGKVPKEARHIILHVLLREISNWTAVFPSYMIKKLRQCPELRYRVIRQPMEEYSRAPVNRSTAVTGNDTRGLVLWFPRTFLFKCLSICRKPKHVSI
ncbi:hypothetical protein NQ317_017500 [Molorchus minor]|uniref:Uncharacterized protein n=1 Tax=Molorchus minor TaxID=1323400 RepID=A0ABQ9JQA5_9CUCU|nr:hypothetical protein NQ317_017500 [Molorchus minor]